MRGWVSVNANVHDGQTVYEVYEWSEHYDSGALVKTFAQREDAERYATAFAATHGKRLETAEVIDLASARAADG